MKKVLWEYLQSGRAHGAAGKEVGHQFRGAAEGPHGSEGVLQLPEEGVQPGEPPLLARRGAAQDRPSGRHREEGPRDLPVRCLSLCLHNSLNLNEFHVLCTN